MGAAEYLTAWCAMRGRQLSTAVARAVRALDVAAVAIGEKVLSRLDRLVALRLTLPWAIVTAGTLVALAILLGPVIAPYRFTAVAGAGFWRFNAMVKSGIIANAITGTAMLCIVETDPFDMACSAAQRPERRRPTADDILGPPR